MQRKILLTLTAAATAWWRAYCDRHRRRQVIAELEAFSDRELNDIGVRARRLIGPSTTAFGVALCRKPRPKCRPPKRRRRSRPMRLCASKAKTFRTNTSLIRSSAPSSRSNRRSSTFHLKPLSPLLKSSSDKRSV
jgi:hypothetical protein